MKFGAKVPVVYKNGVSIRSYIDNIKAISRHYHDSVSVLFSLKGNLHLFINDEEFFIKENDVILINSGDTHEAYSEGGCICAVVQFNLKDLHINEELTFDCFSGSPNADNNVFNHLRKCIAMFIKESASSGDSYSYMAVFYEFLSVLRENFIADASSKPQIKSKYQERADSIVKYVEENYKKGLTLKDVADHEFLSVSYLSSFFERMFNKNFLDFYNDIRLSAAVDDLLYTEGSIAEIAANNGFNDPRSFVSIFKKRYNTLPSNYRRTHKQTDNSNDAELQSMSKEEIQTAISVLNRYYLMNETKEAASENSKALFTTKIGNIDYSLAGEMPNRSLNTFLSVGSAYDILLSDVQDMLKRAQKDIGFRYIKFHGILNDNMGVYSEDEQGNPRYSFFLIDKIISFLLSINLKPLIQLSFMPKDLAIHPEKKVFNEEYITSYPKDMKKWKDLVEALMDHFLSQYGQAETESWLFTIWNEEETGPKLFGMEEGKSFFEFYKETYESVKKVLPTAKMGSTSFSLMEEDTRWIKSQLEFCKKENLPLDFLTAHYFSDVFTTTSENYAYNYTTKHHEDADYFRKSIASLKKMLQDISYPDIPIYLTTFNFTASHRQLINDTCFKSCYVAKNYLETYGELDSFGYWTLTDLNHESFIENDLFHGGLGFFTKNGIEKSAYNAFLLLNKLDNEIIAKGEGYFITKSYKKVHVFLYNYIHHNSLFANGELVIDNNNRYLPFDMKRKRRFSLKLSNLDAEKAFIKHYVVNEKHGSSYDSYVRMGNTNLKNEDEIQYLKANSIPQLLLSETEILNNELSIDVDMAPLEIRLIEIKLR